MTKSTRHKRTRKAELKKIKLKVGRKLKKPQNETKTDFKAKKIILKEQLAEKSDSSMITKKKLNINELLSRLSHHSVYVRQDGLNGLKELVAKNSKLDIGPYLSLLFTKLNPCLLDTDHLIRSSTVKVVELIIKKIGNMISPYFNLLASHLSCAMVHLNAGVQSDSLLLMDVLLEHTPAQIAQSANKILKHYFHLISRQINRKTSGNTRENTFTLISNPNSQLASIKWRIKLLKSLSKYVDSIMSQKTKLESSILVSHWQVITMGCFPCLVREGGESNFTFLAKLLITESEAQSFVTTMVPLLFQTWAEVDHNTSSHSKLSGGTPLDPIAIEVLRYISEIILNFWNVTEIVTQRSPLQCDWFSKTMKKHFDFEIFSEFPYCPLEGPKSTINKSAKANCQRLNVTLATLAFHYHGYDEKLRNRVARCYIDLMNNCEASSDLNMESLSSSVSFLLKSSSGLEIDVCEELLFASLSSYRCVKEKSRFLLLKIPLQASEFSCKNLWQLDVLGEWMRVVVEDAIAHPSEELILELLLQWKLRNTPRFAQILDLKKDLLRERIQLESLKNTDKSNVTVII